MSRTTARLSGKRCQCPSCGECFSTVGNFDKHRKGAHGVDRACIDPAAAGLEIKHTNGGTFWAAPGRAE